MTIHSEHPFASPEGERDPVRRFRGRLGAAVVLWTAGAEARPDERAGLPVSSTMVVAGDPPHVLGLLDPDSDLAELVQRSGAAVVQVLQWQHRHLADAFAGLAPAPGGVFRMAQWTQSPWGPVLDDASAWAGVRLAAGDLTPVGWSLLVDTVIEQVELREETGPVIHRRGRYQRLTPQA